MKKEQYEELNKIWSLPPIVIGIDDLQDKSDRTLLYGYTCDRDTWHVYVRHNEILTVVYPYGKEPTRIEVESNRGYVPDKRLYPQCCDFEFCKLLKEKGVDLPFTTWEDLKEEKQYYGKYLPF